MRNHQELRRQSARCIGDEIGKERGEVLTYRGLRGGVGRDELAEVARIVRRPPAERALHLRAAAAARFVPPGGWLSRNRRTSSSSAGGYHFPFSPLFSGRDKKKRSGGLIRLEVGPATSLLLIGSRCGPSRDLAQVGLAGPRSGLLLIAERPRHGGHSPPRWNSISEVRRGQIKNGQRQRIQSQNKIREGPVCVRPWQIVFAVSD
jgi:hypothetical protein